MQIADRPGTVQPGLSGLRHLVGAELATLVALGLAKLALHLATSGLYGFHRDELYYLASGRHPALGYVDYPPLTPLLGRLGVILFGASPGGLRVLSALAGAVVVVLTGLIARELGGGRFGQALAAGAALASPLLLGANWLFQTVTFDQLTWTVAILLVARLVRTGQPRWWLAVGLVLGIGLETKYTILVLGAGLLAAALATPLRRHLRTPWPWLGALTALLVAAPNLAWQVAHGWPSLAFILSHHQDQASDFSAPVFLALQLPLVGPLALPLWLAGWYRLLRHGDVRPLGIAAAVAFGIFLVVGKNYYAGPLYPLLLAAGAVAVEAAGRSSRSAPRLRAAAVAAVSLNGLLLLPLTVPLVPVSQLHRLHLDAIRKDYADTVGWPELTDQVTAVYAALPPGQRRQATILASDYGEAGAIDLYGPARGLPPAICPQLTYGLWKPAHVDDATVITVGYTPEFIARYFAEVEPAAIITPPDGVRTEERGLPILVAHRPRVPLDQAWSELQRFS